LKSYGFRTSSGSLAIFAAIRRASSRVSSLAADPRPLRFTTQRRPSCSHGNRTRHVDEHQYPASADVGIHGGMSSAGPPWWRPSVIRLFDTPKLFESAAVSPVATFPIPLRARRILECC